MPIFVLEDQNFRTYLRTFAGCYPTASHPTTLYVDPGNKIYSLIGAVTAVVPPYNEKKILTYH